MHDKCMHKECNHKALPWTIHGLCAKHYQEWASAYFRRPEDDV